MGHLGSGSLWSVLQIVAGFCLSFTLGFGVSFSLLPKEYRRYALIAAPTAGYAVFCLLAIVISANLRIPANTSIWIAAGLLLALSTGAAVAAVRRGEVAEMGRAARPAAWALGLMLVMVFWPVLYQGNDLYLGTANPDFYQSLAYQEVLARFNIGALDPRPAMDYSFNPFLGMFPDPLPAKFGGVMFSLLQQQIFGLAARSALMAALVVFLLGLPLATYLFSKTVLQVDERVAAASALLMAVSGPVTMSFMHVLVGQNSALALLPLGLSICYLAVATRHWKALLFAFLLLDATFWMYVSILPYIAAPIGLYALYDTARLRREGAAKRIATAIAIFVGGAVALQLGMGPQMKQLGAEIIGLLGRANRSVYVDFLTEMSLPYSLGISSYPFGASLLLSRFSRPDYVASAAGLVAFSFLCIAFYFWSVAAWAKQAPEGARQFILIMIGVYLAVWVYFTFISLYGYAIFKMASWLQFAFMPFVAYGLHALVLRRARGSPGRVTLEAVAASVVGVALIGANVLSSIDFDLKSLGRDRLKGAIVNSYGIGGNPDYPQLASALPQIVKPGEVVAIAMPDYIANLWTAYYVVKGGMRAAFVSHDDFPDEDAALPDVRTGIVRNSAGTVEVYRPRYFTNRPAYYLLEGPQNLNQEIAQSSAPPKPAWSDGSFVLMPASEAKDVLLTGRGFYRLEYFDREHLSWWWPDKMRWTPEGGELILINASRPDAPHYLSLVVVAGKDREKPRHLELWLNGKLFDEIEVHGAARIVSKAFHPTGGRDKLVVKVREQVHLAGRNFGLWNRQIATDQRYLNVLLAQARVFTADDGDGSGFRGKLGAKELLDRARRFDGISLDGWAMRRAYFELPAPPGSAHKLTLSISIPGGAGFKFPFVVRFHTNGHAVEKRFDKPGDHEVRLDADSESDSLSLTMESEQSALVAGVGEGSFLLKSVGVE